MNNDDHKQQPIGPDLEARIVAWVLGEASPFEAAELSRMVSENPDLAAFKAEMERTHGLVNEAIRPPVESLKLSAEKRAKLIALLGDSQRPLAGGESSVTALPPRGSPRDRLYGLRRWAGPLGAVAALFLVAAFALHRFDMHPNSAKFGAQEDGLVKLDPFEISSAKKEATDKASHVTVQVMELPKLEESGEAFSPQEAPSPTVTFTIPDMSGASYFQQKAAAEHGLSLNQAMATQNARRALSQQLISTSNVTILNGGSNVALNDVKENFGGLVAGYNAGVSAGQINESNASTALDQQAPAVAAPSNQVELNSFAVQQDVQKMEPEGKATVQGDSMPLAGKQMFDQGAITLESKEAPTLNSDSLLMGGTQMAATAGHMIEAADQMAASQQVPVTQKDTFFGAGALVNDDAAKIGRVNSPASLSVSATGGAVEKTLTSAQAVSTFSLHVGDASFRVAQTLLASGRRPDPASIRPEEFYNAFDYGDPAPARGEAVACHIEQSAHPFLPGSNLVRVSLQVPSVGRDAGQPLRLTILLDTSGSMEREDRAASVRQALASLAALLKPQDQVTLIGFARQPRLLADRVSGTEAAKLVDIARKTPADGGTNFEEALKFAGTRAKLQFLASAQNRIVALTDGAANLGNDSPDELSQIVGTLRREGISFDACGVGVDGLNDTLLEALTRKGEGHYNVINSPADAGKTFGSALAGQLRPSAENVKVQVHFNPARVTSYRLIGFEQHMLKAEDFHNDQVAAADLASGATATAIYQVDLAPDGQGDLGNVAVRFLDMARESQVERSWTLPYDPSAPTFDRASASMQLAGCSALLAESLRGGASAGAIRLSELQPIADSLRTRYPDDARVISLAAMVRQAAHLEGK